MKRYKLVRIIDGEFFSANTIENPILYKVGEVAGAEDKGIACYKSLKSVDKPSHIEETRYSFNGGNPIAILEVEPRSEPCWDTPAYGKGGVYAGGINYQSVKVLSVVRIIK